jgi:hypothetical protein
MTAMTTVSITIESPSSLLPRELAFAAKLCPLPCHACQGL